MKICKRAAIVFFSLLAILNGCQSGTAGNENTAKKTPAKAEKKITLNILYSGENVNWVAAVENLGDLFMRENPGITLNLEHAETNLYGETLKVKEATGEFPDILEMQDPAVFQKAGKLGEMPASVSCLVNCPTTIHGKVYAIPLYSTTEGIIYNQVLFEKYHLSEPKTYGDFLNLCAALKSSGVAPLAVGGSNFHGMDCWLDYFFQTDVISGTPDWQSLRNQRKVSFRDSAPVRMLKDYRSLMTGPYVLEDSADMNDNQMVSQLIDGRFAMMYADPSLLLQIIDAYPQAAEPGKNTLGESIPNSRVKCRVGWFFLPDREGNPVAVSRLGAQWAISQNCEKDADRKNAAAQFLQYLFATDNYRKILQFMYAIPTTRNAILYPAAGVQQKLLVKYRYAEKSKSYFGNGETPEWFLQPLNKILSSVAANTVGAESAAQRMDAIWDSDET